MTSNFEFLKNKDKKLFGIIDDDEKLYRDGYFEQTIAQSRKFAEIVCKNVLGVRRTTENTFDEMLSTLKDILGENPSDVEFIDDMYFIKNKGNLAVHDSAAPLTGSDALECLQRAFEISINYAIKNNFANKKIINSHYSIDLLMTGKNYKFKEKYQEIKESADKEGIDEIVERAKAPDDKVIEADFKKKKRIKSEKTNKKEAKKTKQKKPKENPKEKEQNKDIMFYSLVFGTLFILLICIMIFILPF